MNKVLVLGNGFVAEHLKYDKYAKHLPIDDGLIFKEKVLERYSPDVVINCIGFTGRPNIDQCEEEKNKTYNTNVVIPLILAEACDKAKVHLIHIGSGCVYFGQSPNTEHSCTVDDECLCDDEYGIVDTGWKETDFANPKSYYSKSKYACDLLLGNMPHVTTLRIRMPISELDTPRNLISKLKEYRKIIHIPNSITFMSDLVRCIDWAIDNKPSGIFHVVNPQPLSAARVMTEFKKYIPEHEFEIINEQQLDSITKAKRSNCILNADKLQATGFKMSNSEEMLERCMFSYIKNLSR